MISLGLRLLKDLCEDLERLLLRFTGPTAAWLSFKPDLPNLQLLRRPLKVQDPVAVGSEGFVREVAARLGRRPIEVGPVVSGKTAFDGANGQLSHGTAD
jgi:hypothetical protein